MDDLNLDQGRNSILGELDQLNAQIGLAKSFLKRREDIRTLTEIQHDLFILQAHIAYSQVYDDLPRARIFELQMETQRIESRLPLLSHFILPEGTRAACALHGVRTQARAIERGESGYLHRPSTLAMYMDRLACLTFALARKINRDAGIAEQAPHYGLSRS